MIGGVEALWKSLNLADTTRARGDVAHAACVRALEVLRMLRPLREQSRGLHAALSEAASAVSDYLKGTGAGDEQTRRLAGFVEDLQAK